MRLTAAELASVRAQGLFLTEKCDGCGKALNQTFRYTITGRPEAFCSALCRDNAFFADRREAQKHSTPGQCVQGQPSPNPGGRPKKAPISDAYARHIEDPLPEDLRSKLRLPKGATWADAMALGQLRSAVKGNTVAAKEIADRVEGRVTQPIGGENGEPVEVKWTVEVIGGGGAKNEKQQAISQNSAFVEPEPGRAERQPWERPRKEIA